MILPFLTHWEGLFSAGATLIYLVAMLLLWTQLFFQPAHNSETPAQNRSPGDWGRILLWLGAVVHLAALAGQGPALFMFREGVAGLFGWILVVTYLMIGQKLGVAAGSIVTPVALAAALFSLAAPPLHAGTPPRGFDAFWLTLHVIITLGGYVALAFAFAASLLYLVQENLLKHRKLSGLWRRLPSLHVADEWIFRATAFGLALLTMGIGTGVFFGAWHEPRYSPLHDPKVLFSMATWLTFALYLGARVWLGWHGRRSNLVVIYGFVLMVISFLGTAHLVPAP